VRFTTTAYVDAVLEVDGVRYPTSGLLHAVDVARLTGARHHYRVLLDGQEVAASTVATLPTRADTLRFVVYGDTRDGADLERQIVARIVDEMPDLALYTGDVVPAGDDEDSWRHFVTVEDPLLSQVPVLFALGNHELYRDAAGDHVARYLGCPTPAVPSDGARPGFYYEQRIGDVVFLILDGNGRIHEQALWLEARLTNAQATHARHVFVVLHQPPFSVGTHCGAAVAQAEWVALFERFSVRAVFGGHDHAYERLERNGVRYFVSGGGGAPLYPEEPGCAPFDIAARRTYRAEHHYLLVTVHGDDVEVSAMPLDPRAPPLEVTRFGTEPAAASWGPPLVDGRVLRVSGTTSKRLGLALAVLLSLAALAVYGRRGGRGRRRTGSVTAKGA
jgi:acid phosphatase type 7